MMGWMGMVNMNVGELNIQGIKKKVFGMCMCV